MRGAWALLLGLAAVAPALGQEVSLAPSPAVRCLTPAAEARGTPEYPFDPWKRGQGGRVRVELVFTTPDRRPQVLVHEREGDPAFVDAVTTHVERFRVPCLEDADVPVRLRQEYVFKPDQRSVAWTTPVDEADAERRLLIRCMVNTSGKPQPDYPVSVRRQGLQGRLVAVARYVAPDTAPSLQVHAVGDARRLAWVVEEWMQTMRMPCLGKRPVEVTHLFHFVFEGDPAYGFRDVTLAQFVGRMRGILEQRVDFDTTTMGCPFDIKLRYLQPYLPNNVGQVGTPDERRQPLLDWLSRAVLDLNSKALESVFGDIASIHVPCLRINLNPDEKS